MFKKLKAIIVELQLLAIEIDMLKHDVAQLKKPAKTSKPAVKKTVKK